MSNVKNASEGDRRPSAVRKIIRKKKDRAKAFVPPKSPFGLLEEELYSDPWKLLVGCLFLNKTTACQVRISIPWKNCKDGPSRSGM